VEEPETGRGGEPLLSLNIDKHAHGAALPSCTHGGDEFVRLLEVLKNADDAFAFLYRPATRVELELNRIDAVMFSSKASLISALIGASILPCHTITKTLL
jgi:hypothetical protein